MAEALPVGLLVAAPVVAGLTTWVVGRRRSGPDRRLAVGTIGAAGLAATAGLAVVVALDGTRAAIDAGPGWQLTAAVTPLAGVVAVLVPAVALPIAVWAASHESERGLGRLVGGLVAFVGAMELLVVAGDLLTLLIGWELVGAFSWGLIAHEWRDPTVPSRAAHAFNATRAGDLGLFAAAGAAMAGAGGLDYTVLAGLEGWPLHVLVAGVVVAAVAKSAQGPFAPWLFSAMAGPTSVSALLHSATMVAAGAYVLARLHPVLDRAGWFAPVVIAVGLATALAGGLVAVLQTHAKKLLAASTSAQYGLMLVAVGAGWPAAAGAHLVTHAVAKALLFLVAGIAMTATGSALLGRHRLGSHLRWTAGLSAVGALALAAVPPLGAAWTKEELVAAAGHAVPWLALAVAAAGGLAAAYAARFQLLAYGPTTGDDRLIESPTTAGRGAATLLAAASVALGVLFLPGSKAVVGDLLGGELPTGAPWELVASLLLVGAGAGWAAATDRRGRLGSLGTAGRPAVAAGWLGLPAAARTVVVDPVLRLAAAAARFDDRVVDAGVRGAAAVGRALSRLVAGPEGAGRGVEWSVDRVVQGLAGAAERGAGAAAGAGEAVIDGLVEGTAGRLGIAGRDSRRLQTGMAHHYLMLIVVGLAAAVVVAGLWR